MGADSGDVVVNSSGSLSVKGSACTGCTVFARSPISLFELYLMHYFLHLPSSDEHCMVLQDALGSIGKMKAVRVIS